LWTGLSFGLCPNFWVNDTKEVELIDADIQTSFPSAVERS